MALPSVALAGCGSGNDAGRSPAGASPSPSARERALADAARASTADFPAADGRTLRELASEGRPGPNVGLAVSVVVPGTSRLGFGLLDSDNRVVYAKSAVYVAEAPDARAEGPYPAPADSLITEPRFRSRFAATEADPFAAIYGAEVPFRRAGHYSVLVLSRPRGELLAATTEVRVKRDSAVPAVGERPPRIDNDTVASAAGDLKSIETRIPPDDMHDVRFKDVLGRKPVALLFATPALCESRTCGPVTDILLQLKQSYGDRVAFIHQEVFLDNDPSKGYRKPLRDFHLTSEPWLFTVDRSGRVAARLEGAFGLRGARRAIEAALR